jgi:hypothetical protein
MTTTIPDVPVPPGAPSCASLLKHALQQLRSRAYPADRKPSCTAQPAIIACLS